MPSKVPVVVLGVGSQGAGPAAPAYVANDKPSAPMLARVEAPALDRPWRRPGAIRYALAKLRNAVSPPVTVTEPPADIVIDRDVAVPTRDGTVLRANVFRPTGDSPHPVIVSTHPYGKDNLPHRRGGRWIISPQYHVLRQPGPLTFSALTGWEAPDPAWWVPRGFAVVNADLRGCGHSDGVAKLLSHQESEDTYDLVQWAAEQPWSDGRVVMLGVSYLAINQYGTASLRPPALKAICPWEGFTDIYRDFAFPGGIRENGFMRIWSLLLRRSARLAYDLKRMADSHPLRDDFWRSLVPDLAAIEVPMLVCGSFSDQNLHSRGSMRAFTHTGSTRARLYTHRGGKWTTFYSDEALAEQLAFFRGVLDGGDDAPARCVRLELREDRDTITAVHEEAEWPLARTHWTPLYLAGPGQLATEPASNPGSVGFTRSHAAVFSWTFAEDTELTGPMAARLWVEARGCDDLNLFVGVEKWRDGRFVPFEGAFGYGRDRVATGWQRASLRALDPDASSPWEPVPAAIEPQPLRAGEVVAVDVALGPSATLFRAGEQLRLVVAGRWLSPRNPLTGQFPVAYPHPPRGRAILHWGSGVVPGPAPHLLVPEIPA
jgi:putative CocE/NonD family hydrolase